LINRSATDFQVAPQGFAGEIKGYNHTKTGLFFTAMRPLSGRTAYPAV